MTPLLIDGLPPLESYLLLAAVSLVVVVLAYGLIKGLDWIAAQSNAWIWASAVKDEQQRRERIAGTVVRIDQARAQRREHVRHVWR